MHWLHGWRPSACVAHDDVAHSLAQDDAAHSLAHVDVVPINEDLAHFVAHDNVSPHAPAKGYAVEAS
jgi:hypothetical protein